jgi:hypothetical protein
MPSVLPKNVCGADDLPPFPGPLLFPRLLPQPLPAPRALPPLSEVWPSGLLSGAGEPAVSFSFPLIFPV